MKKQFGPFLIMIAAAFWAADALLRTGLTRSIPSGAIVLYEHLIGFIILIPFFLRSFKEYKLLNAKDWIVLLLMTVVSSVAGTLLFTEALSRSFAVYDFATPILLQKLQPVFVIVLASLWLKEKITLRFIALTCIALIGSYLISFGADPVNLSYSEKSIIVFLAIGAAAAWGFGTVMSKRVLNKLSFSGATAMRFALAIPVSLM